MLLKIMVKRSYVSCLIILLICLHTAYVRAGQNGSVSAGTTISVRHPNGPIQLDGCIEENARRELGDPIELVQQSPKPGESSPNKTNVKVPVAADRLYFGKLVDGNPGIKPADLLLQGLEAYLAQEQGKCKTRIGMLSFNELMMRSVSFSIQDVRPMQSAGQCAAERAR